MASPLRERLRSLVARWVEWPTARFLLSLGLTPNGVTLLGFGVGLVAAGLAGAGWLLTAGLVFLAGSALDMLDGALARLTGKATPFGALLDSTTDRLSEGALLLGIAVHAVRADLSEARTLVLIVLAVVALLASQMVSYVRARGEGLGIPTKEVGLLTRTERVVLFTLGLVLAGVGIDLALEASLGVIAALSFLTLMQRLAHIGRAANHS